MNGNSVGIPTNEGIIKTIVRAIVVLAAACYSAIFSLLVLDKTVPNELWIAAGNLSTALVSMLVRTSATPTTPLETATLPPTAPGNVHVPAQELEIQTPTKAKKTKR